MKAKSNSKRKQTRKVSVQDTTESQPDARRKRATKPGASPSPAEVDETKVTDEPKPFTVVGIGASAGGYEAVSELLKHLPVDVGMAYAVVQHLDPIHESKLSELLSRATQMKVVQVENRTSVAPNCVYVIPPNRELTLSDGKFAVRARVRRDGQYMPIDLLFRSLAAEQRNQAIGVLLSGNGSDGTLGLKAIKAEGGITFAQDARSAKFHGMPASACKAGCVDVIAPPTAIAAELARMARHPSLRPNKTGASPTLGHIPETDYSRIHALLRAATGVDFSHYKPNTLRRRILRRMVLKKIEALPEYVRYLEHNAGEINALFEDILINVTEFFRDSGVFQVLKRRILPRIMKSKPTDVPLRVWVPGCSTGEEVYSLAICIHEYLGKQASPNNVQIFATDISDATLAKARLGIYPPGALTGVSPERLRGYFQPTDGSHQIAKFIRDLCVFARHNVAQDPPFSKLDLISCRNVLIYFGQLLQKKILPTFHYALNPYGYLLLGSSETIGAYTEFFTLVDKRTKIYSRRLATGRPEASLFPLAIPGIEEGFKASKPGPESVVLDLRKQVDQLLLSRYLPAGVLINANWNVLEFRGQSGRFLEHPPGEANLNLLRMARQGLVVDLRTALSKAAKSDEPVRQDGVRFRSDGQTRLISIEVLPFRGGPAQERFFLVLFLEHGFETDEPATVRKAKHQKQVDHGTDREFRQLQEELRATKESLQAIIEEQEATNEELKSANEEIQSSNEELQSTNEELETAKEELQSTNEELTTLNEELQNRNHELAQVNNDLTNLIGSFNLPILILGNDLTVRRFTPMAEKIFNLIPSDVGRQVSDINPKINFPDLSKAVSEVIETLHTREVEVQDRDSRWFSLRIRPYRTTENKIDGAVLVLIDIDEIKQALTEVISLVSQPVVILSGDLRVLEANPSFYQRFQLNPAEAARCPIYQLGNGEWNTPALHNLLDASLPERGHVTGFRVEQTVPNVGPRTLFIHARRLHQPIKGGQLVILLVEDGDQSGTA